jgi:hypothetical protein
MTTNFKHMAKEPRIIQIGVNRDGRIRSVLYDDGRIFNRLIELESGETIISDEWESVKPPILSTPIPTKQPRTGRRGRKQK